MLGEIYIATALAIFLAIFGWSERLFGLSSKHKNAIVSFCEKTKLTYKKYNELMILISKNKTLKPGRYMIQLVNILKGTLIKKEDKDIMNKFKDNSDFLKKLNESNNHKKTFFIILFSFLFIGGTALIFIESKNTCYFESVITAQIILLILIGIGTYIYKGIMDTESKIQNNLLSIVTAIGDTKHGRKKII
ncbi:MAG: hypothetical protein ABIE94_03340 [archaeon]